MNNQVGQIWKYQLNQYVIVVLILEAYENVDILDPYVQDKFYRTLVLDHYLPDHVGTVMIRKWRIGSVKEWKMLV